MKNKDRALAQLRGRKWAQKGVNEVSFFFSPNNARKSVKIDIHCANATFRMKNFEVNLY